nr:hypothetical protein GCM10020093_025780 [Planobispora longispora]
MRLRRLITEREEVPDALVAVLRERIDAAERRRILVTAPPFGGNLPELPAAGRTCSERRSGPWTGPDRGPGSRCPRCPPW